MVTLRRIGVSLQQRQELLNGSFLLLAPQQQNAQLEMCWLKGWVAPGRFGEFGDRPFDLPGVAQCQTEVKAGLGRVRAQLHGLAKRFQRSLLLVLVAERDSESDVRRDVLGVQLENLLEFADRRVPRTLLEQAHASLVEVGRALLGHARRQRGEMCEGEKSHAVPEPAESARRDPECAFGRGWRAGLHSDVRANPGSSAG